MNAQTDGEGIMGKEKRNFCHVELLQAQKTNSLGSPPSIHSSYAKYLSIVPLFPQGEPTVSPTHPIVQHKHRWYLLDIFSAIGCYYCTIRLCEKLKREKFKMESEIGHQVFDPAQREKKSSNPFAGNNLDPLVTLFSSLLARLLC